MKTVDSRPQAQVPCDIDKERFLLGTIIADPMAFDLIRFLEPGDFYRDCHQVIYEAMQALDQENRSIDYISLCDQIERMGKEESFENSDYISYLSALLNDSEFSASAEDKALDLKNISVCRKVFFGAPELTAAAYHKDVDQVVSILEQLGQDAHSKMTGSELLPLAAGISDFMIKLDQLHLRRGKVVGVPSGLTDLDRLLGGFQKSDLIIIAARPAVGKTSLCLTVGRNAAKAGKGVAVFSLEMSKEQLIQRLVSMEGGIDQQRLRTGWIEDEEWERIAIATETLSALPLYIDDTPAITCAEIRSKVRRLISSGVQIDMIIVDYLQLMRAFAGTANQRTDNRVQEVSEISRQLKGLARELDIPVIALAQLSRAVESRQSKIPQLSDLRESGSIEQDSDVVMFIYRDDVYNPDTDRPNQADIIVAKHRNGPVGDVSVFFRKSHTEFRDLEVSPPSDEDDVEY